MIETNHNFYYTWDILGLYRQLFGHVGTPIGKVTPLKTGSDKGTYDDRFIGGEKGKQIIAWDGNDLTSKNARISDLKGQYFMMPLTIVNYTFPIDPLISVSGRKEVIKTVVTGTHPVVEDQAMDNYQITIKGVFINEDNDDYPYSQVQILNRLLLRRGGLMVVNKLLSAFNINQLVVTGFKIDAVEGEQSMQWYIIDAINDRPVKLEYPFDD